MHYAIIGTGPAGVVAAERLRHLDVGAAISIIGDEPETPYSRMALPYFLAGDVGEHGTHLRRRTEHFGDLNIDLKTERVRSIDAAAKRLTFDSGERLEYGRLLIASGSHTVRPPVPGMDLAGVENCWTLADARRIIDRAAPGSKVVLMGAGFIGCIVLESLVARGTNLTVIEMADRMLPRMMDVAGGEMIKRWCEQKGVGVMTSTAVESVEEAANGALRLKLSDGSELSADLVVCATGVRPNVDFLEGTGVAIEDGVVVDHYLRTNVADIYAAGDVAQGPDVSTGGTAVHAIQPTASEHGRIAAHNMFGMETYYPGSLSMNVLNTLGLVSSSFGLWEGAPGGERSIAEDQGSAQYLRLEFKDDRLVGALALGLTQHVGVIRGLMQTQVSLGERWKAKLLADPHAITHAYLDRTQTPRPIM